MRTGFLLLLFAVQSFSQNVRDYDGNIYSTVVIGKQVWLRENLASLHYSDGTPIAGAAVYNDNDSLGNIYGRLYTWNAAMNGSVSPGAQGACPCGWHLPTAEEWSTLENSLGGSSIAGGKMKETGTLHWSPPNTGAGNSSGFSALPGGEYDAYYQPNVFRLLNEYAVFWTSTQISAVKAREKYLSFNSAASSTYDWYKVMKYSVRCIKDTAKFSGTPRIGYAPLNVQFNAQITCLDGINSWSWDLNNDGTMDSFEESPVWTYTDTGKYSVRLVVSNGSATDTLLRAEYIRCIAPCDAGFSAMPLSGYAPLRVQFTDSSAPLTELTSWEWDFDNNETIDSRAQHPVWTYAIPGEYSVKLKISDRVGTDSLVRTDYINVLEPCLAAFTATPTQGYKPLTVHFNDASTPLSRITDWAWDFDQNGTIDSHVQHPDWTYSDTGRYTVRLIVSDGAMSDTLDKVHYVRVIQSCTIGFSGIPLTGFQPLEVHFTDESIPQASVVSWSWDFDNDGTIDSHERSPIHMYTEAGMYTVTFIISDGMISDTLTRVEYVRALALKTIEIAYHMGWDMTSIPVQLSHSVSLPSLFGYEGRYTKEDSMETGRGYWAKPGDRLSYTGIPVTSDTVDVIERWNIIGSISEPVAAWDIGSIPAGLITTDFYAYMGGGVYTPVDTIMPGKAYWVKAQRSGQLILSAPAAFRSLNRITIVPGSEPPPPPPASTQDQAVRTDLFPVQSYPNPFNPQTTITFVLDRPSFVTLAIYDVLGREIETLLNEALSQGEHHVVWYAGKVPSGVYYCRVTAGTSSGTKNIIYAK